MSAKKFSRYHIQSNTINHLNRYCSYGLVFLNMNIFSHVCLMVKILAIMSNGDFAIQKFWETHHWCLKVESELMYVGVLKIYSSNNQRVSISATRGRHVPFYSQQKRNKFCKVRKTLRVRHHFLWLTDWWGWNSPLPLLMSVSPHSVLVVCSGSSCLHLSSRLTLDLNVAGLQQRTWTCLSQLQTTGQTNKYKETN